jgi:putative hemolysin
MGLEGVDVHSSHYTVDELKIILSESERGGIIDESDREIMQAVLDFGRLLVRQVMIPRTEIIGIQAALPFDEILGIVRKESITKFPVYEENLDEIVGVLHVKRILANLEEDSAKKLTAHQLAREAIFVPETLPVRDLLVRFRDRKQHIAIVLDEYGGTAGLVTLEDLMEEIVGEVSDPFDTFTPEIQSLPNGAYIVESLALMEDVNTKLGLNIDDPYYDTIAGYVLGRLGRIPKEGDKLEIDGHILQIESMDNLRVQRLSLTLISEDE